MAARMLLVAGLVALASVSLQAAVVKDAPGQELALAATSNTVRSVGAWDHPYTDITEYQDVATQTHFKGQYAVERVGTMSSLEGDYNGDGIKDLVTRGHRGRVYVLFGQNNYQTSQYEYFQTPKSRWQEARDFCIAEGGDLASIHSEREMYAAKEACNEYCWIGLVRSNEGEIGPWKWVDDTPVRFTPWDTATGQPQHGTHPRYPLGETRVVFTGDNGDKWHDWGYDDSGYNFRGVCKRTLTTTTMPMELDPEYLDGFNGFMIKGINPSSITSGDINNDGIDDLMLGCQFRRVKKTSSDTEDPCDCLRQAGAVYVILGTRSGFPRELHVSWLYGWNGFRLEGYTSYGRFGHSLSSGGDVNGDGIKDMVIGTFDVDSTEQGEEELYTVFGKAYSQNPVYELNNWAPISSSTKTGSASGTGVTDGSARNFLPVHKVKEVIMTTGVSEDTMRGFQLKGVPPQEWHWLGRDRTGYSISADGDINGDGIADIVIGSYGATSGDWHKIMAGAVYVVLGKPSTSSFAVVTELATLSAPNGFKITGAKRWDQAGMRVDTSSDINNDGIKDIVIGAPGADVRYTYVHPTNGRTYLRWRHNVGAVYVIHGSSTVADIDLSTLKLPQGYAIVGAERGARAGHRLSAVEDLNGDGFGDIVIGMPWSSYDFRFSMKGGAQIFYGRNTFTGFSETAVSESTISCADLHGGSGLTLSGFELFDMAGHSVSVGDFSGDGKPELVIGVPSHWLIARVFEKTGSAMILDLSSVTTVARTTPPPTIENTTLIDFCQCPEGANASTWVICVTMETTEVTDTQFAQYSAFVGQSFLNLLLTGNATVFETPSQLPSNVVSQAVAGEEGVLNVHMTVAFNSFEEAEQAYQNYEGHGDFEITVRDTTEMDFSVVGSPGMLSCAGMGSPPPLQLDAVGFAIKGIEFDWRCMTAGCWVVDLIYTRGPDNSVNSFYLPRTGTVELTDDLPQLQINSAKPTPIYATYTNEEQDTFLPKNFPCGSDGYDPSNPSWKISGCCIPGFLQHYRPVKEFGDNILANDFADGCSATDLTAGPWSGDLFTAPIAATTGVFDGLYHSKFEDVGMAAPGIYKAQVRIDEEELLRHTGMIHPSSSILRRKVDTFVGMANFIPTDYRFLDSSASQIRLTLEKGDFFTVGTSGETESTFIDYFYMRLHEIKESQSDWLQYIAVTFTLAGEYEINDITQVIPLTSVRVGKGQDADTVSWQHACEATSEPAIWTSGTTQTDFSSLLQLDCAPEPRLCGTQSSISDNFVVFHIPLGKNYFSTESDYAAGEKVFVEFVVSVVNKNTNIQSTTTMTAEMPVMPGGTSLWCEAFEATAEMKEIATVDIVVGSAGTQAEMSRLNTISNIDSAALSEGAQLASYSAASIQSGLLTLVAKGDPTVFERDGFSQYSIEMENLLTVHVMESGGTTAATVQSLIESGGAFEVKVDEIAQTGYLDPTPALLQVCTFNPLTPTFSNPIPSPCILRRDVEFSKCPIAVARPCAAIEINPQDTTEAQAYMQSLLGNNDYAAALGKNYSNLLTSTHSLNSRYNRAWWVNPGHVWNPILGENNFQLSQQVMVAALVRLKGSYTPGAAANRRVLLSAPQDYKRGNIGGNIQYTQGDSGSLTRSVELMSEILNVPTTAISLWKQEVKLTSAQACMTNDALKAELQTQLNEAWSSQNTGMSQLYVNSAVVNYGGIDCGARRAASALGRIQLRAETGAYSAATATVETALVMQDSKLNICWISNNEQIISVSRVYDAGELEVDSASSAGCNGGSSDDSKFSLFGLSFEITIAILAGAGVAGCCIFGAIAYFCCMRSNSKVSPSGGRWGRRFSMDFVRRFSGGGAYDDRGNYRSNERYAQGDGGLVVGRPSQDGEEGGYPPVEPNQVSMSQSGKYSSSMGRSDSRKAWN